MKFSSELVNIVVSHISIGTGCGAQRPYQRVRQSLIVLVFMESSAVANSFGVIVNRWRILCVSCTTAAVTDNR